MRRFRCKNKGKNKIGGTGLRLCAPSYYETEIYREKTPLQYRDPTHYTVKSQWRKDHPKLEMSSDVHDITRWKYSKKKDIKRKLARKSKQLFNNTFLS